VIVVVFENALHESSAFKMLHLPCLLSNDLALKARFTCCQCCYPAGELAVFHPFTFGETEPFTTCTVHRFPCSPISKSIDWALVSFQSPGEVGKNKA